MPKGVGGRSHSALLKFLEGIRYPCSKTALLNFAEDREAPDEILDLLEELPDQEYDSSSEVLSAISQVD